VGVPPGFDFQRQKSLGLRTICALVERQLHAQVTFSNGAGVACEIMCRFE
jgi:two-component sensor histidine kinase